MPAPIKWENVPDYEHQYVGRIFTYLPGLPADTGPRESNLVMRRGDKVRVIAAFRNWNGVKGLDVLYVSNLDSTNDILRSHVTVGDLGIPALMHGDDADLFTESRTYGKVQSRRE